MSLSRMLPSSAHATATPRALFAAVSKRHSSGSFYPGKDVDNIRDQFTTTMRHAAKTGELWKKVFFAAAVPCLCLIGYTSYKMHVEEHSHPRPEYVAYPYLTNRYRPFPWGDGNHTLFHNPREQWVPGVGFEKPRHDHDDHH